MICSILAPTCATPETDKPALRITDEQVSRLEAEIDSLNEPLKPLSSFILPGGSQAAAWLIWDARSCGAERRMTELAAEEVVNEPAMRYVNRLSDHLFVLARTLNDGVKPTSCGVPDKILARIKQVFSLFGGLSPTQQLCISVWRSVG